MPLRILSTKVIALAPRCSCIQRLAVVSSGLLVIRQKGALALWERVLPIVKISQPFLSGCTHRTMRHLFLGTRGPRGRSTHTCSESSRSKSRLIESRSISRLPFTHEINKAGGASRVSRDNYVPEIARASKFSELDPSFRVTTTTQLHSAQGLLLPLAKTSIRSNPGTSRIIREPLTTRRNFRDYAGSSGSDISASYYEVLLKRFNVSDSSVFTRALPRIRISKIFLYYLADRAFFALLFITSSVDAKTIL